MSTRQKLPIETGNLLANTRSQALSKHLFAVGFVARQLLETLHIDNPKLQQAAFLAGILHDIGKIDPEFQNWVNKKMGKIPESFIPEDGVHIDAPAKFSFEKHPRHHELSWVLAENLLAGCSLNATQRVQIAHGIYWHHTKPFRKEKDDKFTEPRAIYEIFKKSLIKDKFDDIYKKTLAVLEDIVNLAEKFEMQNSIPDFSKSFSSIPDSFPAYKKYNKWANELKEFQASVRENALNNLVRAAVISADRLVSGCSLDDLEEYLAEGTLVELLDKEIYQNKSTLQTNIKQCLQGFEASYPNSERNTAQSQAAKSLADLKKIAVINETASIGVLQGPAGCGKTKIALEWALNTDAEKIIWVCPRVQVCLGLLHDLTAD
ncbi:CRISPR-associated endonuclease Cas3'' [Facilibium subflavum]|uniref:CRISPR-associated endonuclease Cas3'' n=1 Tax=Facilibium subflavum TaxID=2219058 RepID=UPI000E653CF3|nr:CRISPR-associated endonuclease Cas3'' [Facilibium subflavum]